MTKKKCENLTIRNSTAEFLIFTNQAGNLAGVIRDFESGNPFDAGNTRQQI